jgi:hypothetical protein
MGRYGDRYSSFDQLGVRKPRFLRLRELSDFWKPFIVNKPTNTYRFYLTYSHPKVVEVWVDKRKLLRLFD